MSSEPSLADLIELAKEAGKILAAGYETRHQIDFKGEMDLVTEIDYRSEDFIVRELQHRFPRHQILAEEGGGKVGGRHQWYIDPLDGTMNYAHGVPLFCVSIAYARDGELALAAVFDPLREEMFTAERSRGAWLNGHPLQVSQATELVRCLLVTGFPCDIRDSEQNNLDNFVRLMKITQGVRRLGSAALDLCYVAAGRFDGYWELSLKPWDLAAGILIAAEAGAKVTTVLGENDCLIPPCSVLAAPPVIHAGILTELV